MKRIFKKNQVIITSLVIMIVVAGYLNFTADEATTAVSENQQVLMENDVMDISEEDMLVDVDVNPEEDMADIENMLADTQSESQSESAAEDDIGDVNTIGEAVLTSTAAKNFSASAKLNREQARSLTKETLMEVINNTENTDSIRQEAMDSLMLLTSIAQKELAAETLLEAKGYANSVVSINNETVDVIICLETLTEGQKAQVEDIVKRKAEVETDQIVITTLK